MDLSRREFLSLGALGVMAWAGRIGDSGFAMTGETVKTRVALIKTRDRKEGVKRAIKALGVNPVKGKKIVLKPNFNSSDPFPGSTHNDTLAVLVESLQVMGAKSITMADRSGMGETRQVMLEKGIFALGKRLGFETVVLDELPQGQWVHHELKGSHWRRGVYFPVLFEEAEAIVQTCCLKTHRFGGHITMSLKNTVGMVAKYSPRDGYDFMRELHSSPYQRLMIAEINQLYRPALILMDGLKAFVDGGPDRGKVMEPGVVVAGTDRVGVDAVGVAILKELGSNMDVMGRKVFEQEQISRAAELGLGVKGPDGIEILTDGEDSEKYAIKLRDILQQA
ncbi:MAG: DUF362 domain-containing protein [candidate division NC10 bacterium]|nr:DUF362 domain-containing protein [candidate division NC10 bacterium]